MSQVGNIRLVHNISSQSAIGIRMRNQLQVWTQCRCQRKRTFLESCRLLYLHMRADIEVTCRSSASVHASMPVPELETLCHNVPGL